MRINRPNQAIQFLVPLEGRRKATEEEGGGDWIRMMPVGSWASHHFPTEGRYDIKPENVEAMARNFKRGMPPIRVSGNQEHEGGPAVGWVQELRADADGLEARVAWTELGQGFLDKDPPLYAYVSAEWFDEQWPYIVSATGEKVPWVFTGFALTNNPFFTELPAAAERRADGTVVYTALTAVWEQTENEIRHSVRDAGDFRDDTFRRKDLEPSAVRKVEVGFTITDAMANGVAMVLGKLKPEKVPDGGDADSMVLQSMRWVLKTDEQDGWTLAQAKEWWTKSSFSKGVEMSAPLQAEKETQTTPAGTAASQTGDPAALAAAQRDLEQTRAERDALRTERDKQKAEQDRAALKARFAAVKVAGRALAPAHAEELAARAMEVAEDKREAMVASMIGAIEKGLVPVGELGSVAGDQTGDISPVLIAIAQTYGLTEEQVRKAAARA